MGNTITGGTASDPDAEAAQVGTKRNVERTVDRGDVVTLDFTLNAPFYMAGKKVYFCAQKRRAVVNTTAIVNRVATITNEAARTCSITLTASETGTAGVYLYEVEVRSTDESTPQTAETGTLSIIDDLRK